MRKKITSLFTALLFLGTLTAQTWEQKSSNPGDGRHHPVTFSLDGKGYMTTGTTNSQGGTDDFYQYDPVTDTWTTLPDFPGADRSFSIGDTWDGKAYIGFGLTPSNFSLDDLWEYDATSGNWTELATCPCAGRLHPTFVIEDGLLFVGMGNNNSGNLNDWWEYNISTDTWRALADLPGPGRHHPYMFSSNGDVYTGLGHGNGGVIFDTWYKWDITNEAWVQMNDFPSEGRVAGTQFSIGDRGFVLSGDGDNHSSMTSGEFWEYNHLNDSWRELPPHPGISRWAPGSFAIGDVVYFGAGEIRLGTDAGLENDMWSFDLDAIVSVATEDQLAEITVYPNPATSSIQLKGVSPEDNAEILITNSTGQSVLKQKYNGGEINIMNLKAGFYFLTLQKNNKSVERIKFIKH
jgi:N-acetylneuraminic acid mutarotase